MIKVVPSVPHPCSPSLPLPHLTPLLNVTSKDTFLYVFAPQPPFDNPTSSSSFCLKRKWSDMDVDQLDCSVLYLKRAKMEKNQTSVLKTPVLPNPVSFGVLEGTNNRLKNISPVLVDSCTSPVGPTILTISIPPLLLKRKRSLTNLNSFCRLGSSSFFQGSSNKKQKKDIHISPLQKMRSYLSASYLENMRSVGPKHGIKRSFSIDEVDLGDDGKPPQKKFKRPLFHRDLDLGWMLPNSYSCRQTETRDPNKREPMPDSIREATNLSYLLVLYILHGLFGILGFLDMLLDDDPLLVLYLLEEPNLNRVHEYESNYSKSQRSSDRLPTNCLGLSIFANLLLSHSIEPKKNHADWIEDISLLVFAKSKIDNKSKRQNQIDDGYDADDDQDSSGKKPKLGNEEHNSQRTSPICLLLHPETTLSIDSNHAQAASNKEYSFQRENQLMDQSMIEISSDNTDSDIAPEETDEGNGGTSVEEQEEGETFYSAVEVGDEAQSFFDAQPPIEGLG